MSKKNKENQEGNKNFENQEMAENNSNDVSEDKQVEALEDESTSEWQEKYEELNNKYLRLYSEFDNFRRRTAKEKLDLVLNANENVLKDLLTIVDDFERAMANNESSNDAEAIKEGFILIYNKLLGILISKGLKSMESKGESFNLDFHEAITNIPVEENQKGKVVDVIEKGYFLNEKVLRYAKVVVGQ